MKNALIIHGAYGSPQENWFPWLKTQLENMQYMVHVPQFPTPKDQNLSAWLAVTQPMLTQLSDQSIIIGHSIGATFVLRVLEQLNHPVGKVALVAGFVDDLPDASLNTINHSFYDHSFNWNHIRNQANHRLHFYSDNDPFVPLDRSHELTRLLDAEPILISSGGHFNAAAGFIQFPQLLTAVTAIT